MKKLQDVIIRPLVTERSTELKEKGKYSFEVHPNATKQEIRNAVETIFKNSSRGPGCEIWRSDFPMLHGISQSQGTFIL